MYPTVVLRVHLFCAENISKHISVNEAQCIWFYLFVFNIVWIWIWDQRTGPRLSVQGFHSMLKITPVNEDPLFSQDWSHSLKMKDKLIISLLRFCSFCLFSYMWNVNLALLRIVSILVWLWHLSLSFVVFLQDWVDHINTVNHTAACRDLRNKWETVQSAAEP